METYFYPDELEGGRNLLIETSLKNYNPLVTLGAWSASGIWTYSRQTLDQTKNKAVFSCSLGAPGGNTILYYRNTINLFEYIQENIPLGAFYTASFNIKTNFRSDKVKISCDGTNYASPNPFTVESGEYKNVSYSGILNSYPSNKNFTLGVLFQNENIPANAIVEIDSFKFEAGSILTNWTRSTYDLGLEIPVEIKKFSLGYNDNYITVPESKKLNKDGRNRKLESKEESFVVSNLKIEDMVNKLATNFAKDKNSNNYKLLNLAYLQLKKLEEDLNRQLDWLDINKAKGYALDLIGKRVGIFRGLMDDDKYRVRIKSKISENLSDGTVNTVIQALALALNINVDKVHIRPLFPEGKPATIIIENIPASSLNKAGVTQDELVKMVQKIIATGVRVESINLEGTFRFSPIRNQVVVNAATGLSDVAMTTGGKLGAILSTN